jgi:hypothetical protein
MIPNIPGCDDEPYVPQNIITMFCKTGVAVWRGQLGERLREEKYYAALPIPVETPQTCMECDVISLAGQRVRNVRLANSEKTYHLH